MTRGDTSRARWQRTSRALDRALEASPEDLRAFLAELERDDPEVHREVRSLLADRSAATAELIDVVEQADAERATGQVIGDWRLLRRVGRGGMGEVFLAERADGAYEQRAAVKLVRRGFESPEAVRRFVRERQILARLDHPAIARLLDGGMTSDQRPYLVLEWVDGITIREHLETHRLEIAECLELVLQICDAVESAHRMLVVHRDLKPSNVLVTPRGDVKLLDFGIAKLLEDDDDGSTRTDQRVMTPRYAAPEQILHGRVSTATDVYSLGVLLFELLVGALPHERTGHPTELVRQVSEESPPLASEACRQLARQADPDARAAKLRRARELTGDLDAILLRALAPEPARRYPTVAAMAEDVRRMLDGRPVEARPRVWTYRAQKLLRRHRWAIAAAATILVLLAAGIVGSQSQAARARREARRAERVTGFLVDLFQGADPGRSRGLSLTARELLAEGARRIEQGLGKEPEVRATLADTLARTYRALGALDDADHWAQQSIEERLRTAGEGSPETALSRLTAAEIALDRGQLEPARDALTALLPRLEDLPSDDGRQALRARSALADCLSQLGEMEGALALRQDIADRLSRALGPDDPLTAEALAAVGSSLGDLSRFDEAEAILRDAVRRFERSGSARTPQALEAQMTLADLLDSTDRTPEALEIFARTIEAGREVLGENHPLLGQMLLKEGIALVTTRRGNEAEAVLFEALGILEPLDHFDAGAAWRYLGFEAMWEERFEEAEARFAHAEAWFRSHLGDDHPLTWAAVQTRSFAQTRLGRLDEAERNQRAALAALTRLHGAESSEVRSPMKYLGETLREQGRIEEAIAMHRATLALEQRLFGPELGVAAAVTEHQLALDLLAAGSPDALAEARRLADEIVAYCRSHENDDETRLGLFLATSGKISARRNELERARRELAEAVDLLRLHLGPGRPSTVSAERALAEIGRN